MNMLVTLPKRRMPLCVQTHLQRTAVAKGPQCWKLVCWDQGGRFIPKLNRCRSWEIANTWLHPSLTPPRLLLAGAFLRSLTALTATHGGYQSGRGRVLGRRQAIGGEVGRHVTRDSGMAAVPMRWGDVADE